MYKSFLLVYCHMLPLFICDKWGLDIVKFFVHVIQQSCGKNVEYQFVVDGQASVTY